MTRRISAKSFVLYFLIAAIVPAGAAPGSFEGAWVLNRAKSRGLTGGLSNAEVILVVTQNPKQLTAEQKIIIRGREQPSQQLTYNLDGSESTAEVVRPLAGTMHLRARSLENGRSLELRSTISGENQGKEVTIVTKEVWELAESGKALRILRTRETPDRTQQFRLYFDKQP